MGLLDFLFPSRERERREEQRVFVQALENIAQATSATSEMVMRAVEKISETQAKQIDAINTHLSLFRPNADQPFVATTSAGRSDDKNWLEQQGFPADATPEEQALWILEHDTDD